MLNIVDERSFTAEIDTLNVLLHNLDILSLSKCPECPFIYLK